MPVVDYRNLMSRHAEGDHRLPGGIRAEVIATIEARRDLLGLEDSPETRAARYELHFYGLTQRYIEGDNRERKVVAGEATAYRSVQELVVNVLHRAGGHYRRSTASGLEATAHALAESLLAAEAANHWLGQRRAEVGEQVPTHSPVSDQPAAPVVVGQYRHGAHPFDPAQTALRASLKTEQHLYQVVDRLTRHAEVSTPELSQTL